MIGRLTQRKSKSGETTSSPKSFDDFELKLGDVMRGERATMGKSLLDVQRELRIKAAYIAAIENTDPTVFDTPGFIAGYVRSYARYLNMDADAAFDQFCEESGFEVAHGMSADASGRKPSGKGLQSTGGLGSEAFVSPNTPFIPASDGILSQIDPRAIGSLVVLLGLIGGIGYGALAVLKEVQQVQFAPVEQVPVVQSELDPLQGILLAEAEANEDPAIQALDRLYRPPALDVPVLVSRDAPISTLNPSQLGNFVTPDRPSISLAGASVSAEQPDDLGVVQPQVVADLAPTLTMVAIRPSWVQVTAADGSVIYEAIMEAEQTYEVPLTENAPRLRTGESSAIYFATNDTQFGPVGDRGQVSKNIELSVNAVSDRFAEVVDLEDERNGVLAKIVAELPTRQPGTFELAE
ncbi:DUF4115 domain-containing protein [Epibacterium sp. SM1979]|uniref:DUF4115 domain-containing protein n=1 Tax=Tritonibacter litoralis TaxID=2662264 RepID=A0A843YCN4_9RHOB|nr:helix-turn-helix domain-containing protein [Tritonibacter litoralis]MQQ07425.1 DUF4115 domain-containing protein [Tritonibacter litoralis]